MFHTNILTGKINQQFVENSNIPKLQTHSGLVMYANYLEHLLKDAQDLQRYYKASEERNVEKFRRILWLESQLDYYRTKYNVKQAVQDRKDLAKARMRIRKARAQQYYYFMAGMTYGIRAGDIGKAMYALQTDYPIIEKNINEYYNNNIGEQRTLLGGSYLRKPEKTN